MKRASSTPRRAAAVLAAALILPLTACGDDLATEAAERIAENAGGGEVDIERDGDDMTIRNEDGEVAVTTGGRLPEGFPEDVPLPEGGTLVSGVAADTPDGKGWALTYTVESSAADAVAAAVSRLEAEGYEPVEGGSVSMGEMTISQHRNGTWLVSVSGVESDGTVLQYLVAPDPS